jgi:hypothetical protein
MAECAEACPPQKPCTMGCTDVPTRHVCLTLYFLALSSCRRVLITSMGCKAHACQGERDTAGLVGGGLPCRCAVAAGELPIKDVLPCTHLSYSSYRSCKALDQGANMGVCRFGALFSHNQ